MLEGCDSEVWELRKHGAPLVQEKQDLRSGSKIEPVIDKEANVASLAKPEAEEPAAELPLNKENDAASSVESTRSQSAIRKSPSEQGSKAAKEPEVTSSSQQPTKHTRMLSRSGKSMDKPLEEAVERSNQSWSSAASREGGKLESRLMGWTGRLSKNTEPSLDNANGSLAKRQEGQKGAKEPRKAPAADDSSKDASGLNFTERMSSMFAAASNTLRPSGGR